MSRFERLQDIVTGTLDEPKGALGVFINSFLLLMIYVSIFLIVLEFRYPAFYTRHETLIEGANALILLVFLADFLSRLIFYKDRLGYLKSFNGVVDLLALLPGLISILAPGFLNLSWLRTLRVMRFFRFVRLIRFARESTEVGSLINAAVERLVPWIGIGVGVKGLVVSMEGMTWWPGFGNMTVMLSVSGFAIAVLLGAKLTIVQSRFYELEDAVCRVMGAVTDMSRPREVDAALRSWVRDLRGTIEQNDPDEYRRMKRRTHELERVLERNGVGGPVTAGFHRDVEFILHRLRTRTPAAIEKFLWYVTCVYAGVAIMAIPGLTGFVMVLLIVFVLGGMYFVVDDMDSPLSEGVRTQTYIDLTPLYEYENFYPDQNQTAAEEKNVGDGDAWKPAHGG